LDYFAINISDENEKLSYRDVEYHLSSKIFKLFFADFVLEMLQISLSLLLKKVIQLVLLSLFVC